MIFELHLKEREDSAARVLVLQMGDVDAIKLIDGDNCFTISADHLHQMFEDEALYFELYGDASEIEEQPESVPDENPEIVTALDDADSGKIN